MEPSVFPEINLGFGDYLRDRARAFVAVAVGVLTAGTEVELCQSNHIRHD